MAFNGERAEGGTAPHRFEWVQEPEKGVTPANPAWNPFSGNVETAWDGEPDAGTEARRGIGSPAPVGFFNGPETHEFDFVYDLNQWFVDAAGDTLDPSNDALQRASDNAIAATHTVVSREAHHTGGPDGGGRRIYKVGKGGHPGTATIPFETDDGLPIAVTLSYQFEKFREYSIGQPSAATLLVVESTSANDTTQTLTIEDEGAATSEDVALNGTAIVSTSGTFDNIDALELDAETEGDVIVSVNTGTTTSPAKGTELATISGQNSYPQSGEGDLGVPALGTGSHATAPDPNADAVIFNDDAITKQSGEVILELTSGEAEVDQGLDSNARSETARMNIHPTDTTITLSLSLAGDRVTVDTTKEHLQGTETDIVWTADEGTITFETGRLMSPGTPNDEAGTAKQVLDITYECTGVTVT